MNSASVLVTDLVFIQGEADRKALENEAFRSFLLQLDLDLDGMVFSLNQDIETRIDCTSCGNCCRSLMINVSREEGYAMADRLQTSFQELKSRYFEESLGGYLVMNTIPCTFLSDNKCSIYEHRFSDCREFPHLNKNGFRQRIFGTLMHYGRCPIIYNVMEALKLQVNFVPDQKNISDE